MDLQSYYLEEKYEQSIIAVSQMISMKLGIGRYSGLVQSHLVIPHVATGVKINATHMQLLLTALKL